MMSLNGLKKAFEAVANLILTVVKIAFISAGGLFFFMITFYSVKSYFEGFEEMILEKILAPPLVFLTGYVIKKYKNGAQWLKVFTWSIISGFPVIIISSSIGKENSLFGNPITITLIINLIIYCVIYRRELKSKLLNTKNNNRLDNPTK